MHKHMHVIRLDHALNGSRHCFVSRRTVVEMIAASEMSAWKRRSMSCRSHLWGNFTDSSDSFPLRSLWTLNGIVDINIMRAYHVTAFALSPVRTNDDADDGVAQPIRCIWRDATNDEDIKWVKIIIYWRNRNCDEYAREERSKRNGIRQAASCNSSNTKMRRNGDAEKELHRERTQMLRSFHSILSLFIFILSFGVRFYWRCPLRWDRTLSSHSPCFARIAYAIKVTKNECNAKCAAFT